MGVGVIVIQVGDVGQHTAVGVQQDLVGVHSEDVRQVAGAGSSHEDEGGSFQMFHVFSHFNTWSGVEEDRLCAPSQAHRCTGSALPVPRTAVLTKLV